MRRRVGLRIEHLEDRAVPTAVGTPWPHADRLTLSFAPDGTRVAGTGQDPLGAGQPSGLFAEMAAAGPTPAWQEAILRAFQAWASQTNVNIGLTPDAGSPFGPDSHAPGNTPGGDIRAGAFATSPDALALNMPYNPVTGAWSGTLLYNTANDFSVGQAEGRYDLYTATLNEAGNLLGLKDTTDPSSALYGHYIGVRSGLSYSDVAAIQALYGGPRAADAFEGPDGNQTAATARVLDPFPSYTDPTKYMAAATSADLTTATDVDYYAVTTRADTTSLVVRLEAAGKSLLAAKLTVYDDQGTMVANTASDGPLQGQDLTLTVPAEAGRTYTVRVKKARDDFGVGRYDLKVGLNFNPAGQAAAGGAPVYVADGGTNEDLGTATPLAAAAGSADTRYAYAATLGGAADVDFYRLAAPAATPAPMTVTLTPAVPFGLYAKVTVYDADGNAAPAVVVSDGPDGRYVVQVPNPTASAAYFLKVESVGRNGVGYAGDYDLDVDFARPSLAGSSVMTGVLTQAARPDYLTVNVPVARVFHFTLSAASSDPAVEAGVRVIVYNAAGQPIATLTVTAGRANSGTVFLAAGTYYVRVAAATRTGAPLPAVTYSLTGLVMSDPIDIFAPHDVTDPPPPPPDFTTTDQGDPYYDGLGLEDPWDDPWLS